MTPPAPSSSSPVRPLRWLYHACLTEEATSVGERFAPASLAREGFIHTSYRTAVVESARTYLPRGRAISVLQVDPRRLDARVEVAMTPRGPMPHIHGTVPADAVARTWSLEELERAIEAGETPDEVRGTRFAFVAFEGMTLLDLIGVYDPLSRLSSMGFDAESTCTWVSADKPTWGADGLTLSVREVRPPLSDFDAVIVSGGRPTRVLCADKDVVEWLAAFPPNRLMASVCTGALLLGAAGRLRGKRATTHASAHDLLAAYGAECIKERVVDDGQVVTAGGVTSSIDLGLYLVRRFAGDDVASKIAAQMEYGVL